jgi:undecaprenyl-diphosphatase
VHSTQRSNAGHDPTTEHGPNIDVRKALLVAALTLVLAAAAFTVVGEVAHFGRIQTALHRVDKLWLPVCVVGQLLAYAGYVLAYRDAARASGGPRFGFWTTARVVIFGQGASALGASVGGLAVDFWAVQRTGTKPHTAARRVLALGTIEWTVLSTYACAAAALVLITGARAPLAMSLAWLIVVPTCAILALWFTSPARVRRFTELPQPRPASEAGLVARSRAWIREKVQEGLADAIAGVVLVRHLLSHPLRYRGGAIGYPIYWAGDLLVLYAGLRGFGVHPNLIPLVLAYATSFVISALPLPAGGAGGIEAGMAFALHSTGIPLAPALLGVFVYRLVTFWLPILPALLLLPGVRQLQRELPHVPHTGPDRDEAISFRPASEPPPASGSVPS